MDWKDTSRRQSLLSAVQQRLADDPRVERVEPFGSMADDPDIPDEFSDIDLDVFLGDSVSDREFGSSVAELLDGIAPIRASRTIWLPGFAYVEALWFEGVPPYWHVDVRCIAKRHHPDPAYGRRHEWATGYTHWMLAVKRVARAFRFVEHHRSTVSGSNGELRIPSVVVDDLRELLQQHHVSAQHNEGSADFISLCAEVDEQVLQPARTDPS